MTGVPRCCGILRAGRLPACCEGALYWATFDIVVWKLEGIFNHFEKQSYARLRRPTDCKTAPDQLADRRVKVSLQVR